MLIRGPLCWLEVVILLHLEFFPYFSLNNSDERTSVSAQYLEAISALALCLSRW